MTEPQPKDTGGKTAALTSEQTGSMIDQFQKQGATFFTGETLERLIKLFPANTPMRDILNFLQKNKR